MNMKRSLREAWEEPIGGSPSEERKCGGSPGKPSMLQDRYTDGSWARSVSECPGCSDCTAVPEPPSAMCMAHSGCCPKFERTYGESHDCKFSLMHKEEHVCRKCGMEFNCDGMVVWQEPQATQEKLIQSKRKVKSTSDASAPFPVSLDRVEELVRSLLNIRRLVTIQYTKSAVDELDKLLAEIRYRSTTEAPPRNVDEHVEVINHCGIHWHKDKDTGLFVVTFHAIKECATTLEKAIERLQQVALVTAEMFNGKCKIPDCSEHPAAPSAQPVESEDTE